MNRIVFLVVLASLFMANTSNAQFFWKKKKNKTESAVMAEKPKEDAYKKLIKDATSQDGLFKVHKNKQKLYFEIPKKLMGKNMLISSRVSETSNNLDIAGGQMPSYPVLIKFSSDEEKVYMHRLNPLNLCDKESSMYAAFKRNNVEPIMEAFKVECFNSDSTAYVIDVSRFFCSDKKGMSPFKERTTLSLILGENPMQGSFCSDKSSLLGVKVFPKNLNIKSRLAYTVEGRPFTAIMSRSIIILPDEPMRPRLADARIGYFPLRKHIYTEKEDALKKLDYIQRWRMEPKEEDIEAYKRGELVEPKKPIVWYVDTAIPEKWRVYVKKGIEDWQKAFEKIGFKNAIVAKDYPTKEENPDFDPDDIRYSCYRYITTEEANSMGPMWIDPRSGEIIQGDVLFYSNVTKLLHNWQFVQTAQIDPRVRAKVFEDDLMGKSLRYVAAHEIGHTLGLMHNMGASYSYPVDSLRSAKFTQKYGTTPSIMDYARYNYVAQPGDKGVRMTPPDLGIYDIFAIKWGYKPIMDAKSAEGEKETLNKWILEKKNDRMYHYGPQQFSLFGVTDPASLAESLGDDCVKASVYGIKNLKYILDHLMEWTYEKNSTYDRTSELYNEIFTQYRRYIGHVAVYLGGIYFESPVMGDGFEAFKFVDKKKQKEALRFLFKEIREFPKWYSKKDIVKYFPSRNSRVIDYVGNIAYSVASSSILANLAMAEKLGDKNTYSQYAYMDEVYRQAMKYSLQGRNLNYTERIIQYNYVMALMVAEGKGVTGEKGRRSLYNKMSIEDKIACDAIHPDANNAMVSMRDPDTKVIATSVYHYELEKVYKLLKRLKNTGDRATRAHYKNLYFEVSKFFEN